MDPLLDNPVWHSLTGRDAHLGTVRDGVAWFDEAVSPFVGFPEDHPDGFGTLHALLPPGRRILYATRGELPDHPGWELSVNVEGLQFLFNGRGAARPQPLPLPQPQPVLLDTSHIHAMIALARLTRPGPFNTRTIDFGHYYGFLEAGRLAAMTGQRMHVGRYSEVSAVCTHPDFLGRGYATRLIEQQLALIGAAGETPFLHVRADNTRAIAVYERLGFVANGPMNFYFLKRID